MQNNNEDDRRQKLEYYGLMLITGIGMSVGAGITSWLVKIQTNVLQEDLGWKEAILKGYIDEYLYMHHYDLMLGFAMTVGFLGGVWIISSNKEAFNF